MYRTYGKRILDIVMSVILIICLSPLFITVTIIQIMVTKGRPFFIHSRPGKFERRVGVIKFRTIIEGNGYTAEGQPKVSRFGRFLRLSSIDELPQLLNVLKGDMSLVGPRPLLYGFLTLYDKNQYRRQEIKPGLTGLAQINGRRTLPWEKRFEYDLCYTDNISFGLDLKILIVTLYKVLIAEGAENREVEYKRVMSYEG